MGNLAEQALAPANAARLEAVSGPLKGKLFLLAKDEVSIGRDPSNEISLLDSLVMNATRRKQPVLWLTCREREKLI